MLRMPSEVAQSSVSTRIKALEKTIEIPVFERRHQGVRLAEAGRKFVAELSVGIEQLDRAVRMAGTISHGVEGRICIDLHSPIVPSIPH